jgi:hypothetical protein
MLLPTFAASAFGAPAFSPAAFALANGAAPHPSIRMRGI